MPKVQIDVALCKGCCLCAAACPKKCLRKSGKFSLTGYYPAEAADKAACTGCAACYAVCPDLAITVCK